MSREPSVLVLILANGASKRQRLWSRGPWIASPRSQGRLSRLARGWDRASSDCPGAGQNPACFAEPPMAQGALATRRFGAIPPGAGCGSSVVEHSIGNGEVASSILARSTMILGSSHQHASLPRGLLHSPIRGGLDRRVGGRDAGAERVRHLLVNRGCDGVAHRRIDLPSFRIPDVVSIANARDDGEKIPT